MLAALTQIPCGYLYTLHSKGGVYYLQITDGTSFQILTYLHLVIFQLRYYRPTEYIVQTALLRN
jgi:hypothetical protein